MDSTIGGVILIAALVASAIFGVMYKQKAGAKHAQSGEDKARVQALLEKALDRKSVV